MIKHFFLFLFPCIINGQSETSSRAKMIDGLVKYRHELIAGDESKIKNLSMLNYIWENNGEDESEKIDELLFNAIYSHEILGWDKTRISKKAENFYPEILNTVKRIISDLESIMENKDLIDLLTADILKSEPPFKLEHKTDIYDEMGFYGIENGMSIAELGAGNGTWSVLAGFTFDSLNIYLNEIDQTKLDAAESKINNCAFISKTNRFHYILGNKKSTSLESKNIDKIIIRNTFHHFSKNKAMLVSIKKSLKPNGDLYIFDPVIPSRKEKSGCRKKMVSDKLKKTILKNGFEITRSKTTEHWGWLLIHCKPKIIK